MSAPLPTVPPTSAVKPGVFTTEFWLTLLTVVASVGGQLAAVVPQPWGLVVGALATAAYTISRGLVKSSAGPTAAAMLLLLLLLPGCTTMKSFFSGAATDNPTPIQVTVNTDAATALELACEFGIPQAQRVQAQLALTTLNCVLLMRGLDGVKAELDNATKYSGQLWYGVLWAGIHTTLNGVSDAAIWTSEYTALLTSMMKGCAAGVGATLVSSPTLCEGFADGTAA